METNNLQLANDLIYQERRKIERLTDEINGLEKERRESMMLIEVVKNGLQTIQTHNTIMLTTGQI